MGSLRELQSIPEAEFLIQEPELPFPTLLIQVPISLFTPVSPHSPSLLLHSPSTHH